MSNSFHATLNEAIEHLRYKGDRNSPGYDPDYEELINILAVGNGRVKSLAKTAKSITHCPGCLALKTQE